MRAKVQFINGDLTEQPKPIEPSKPLFGKLRSEGNASKNCHDETGGELFGIPENEAGNA